MGIGISYQNTNKKGQRVVCLEFVLSRQLLVIGPSACGMVFIMHLSVRAGFGEIKDNDQSLVCV